MSTAVDARKEALKKYNIVGYIQGELSTGLLTTAIISVTTYPVDSFDIPYYVGGFIVGIVGLLQALLCLCIAYKGPNSEHDIIMNRETVALIRGQLYTSMFIFMGCVVGIVGAASQGFNTNIGTSDKDAILTLATVIIVGCILAMGVAIFGICIIYTYGRYFGVHFTKRGIGLAVYMIGQNYGSLTVETDANEPFNSSMHITAPTGGLCITDTTDANVQALREQNRLLQEQLRLQQELNQQRNQQFGFQGPPPPPPSYGFSTAAYPPSAPPPSYDKAV